MKTSMVDIHVHVQIDNKPWWHSIHMNFYHKLTIYLEKNLNIDFRFISTCMIFWKKPTMSKWASDWCSTPKQLCFSYIMARTRYNHIIMMMSALYMTSTLKLDLLVVAHWNNSQRVDNFVAPPWHIPSKPVFPLSPYCCVLSGEVKIPIA